MSATATTGHSLEQNDTGANAWFRCRNEQCGFVWLGTYSMGKNRRRQAAEAHALHLERNPHLAYGEIIAPAEIDTLREGECPVCGDDTWNGERCLVCGFTKPPDMFMDPDVEVAKQQDLRQERNDAAQAQDQVSSPTGYVPPSGAQSGAQQNSSGYVPPRTSAGYVPPKSARRQLVGANIP